MNTLLLKKEIRLLLPSFSAAFVLAFLSGLAAAFTSERIGDPGFTSTTGAVSQVLFLLSPMLVIFMALQSFGSEISIGTLPNLLAQPIARTTIWRMKTVLLAAAFLFVWTTWWFLFINNKNVLLNPIKLREAFVASILTPAAIFSGGLWTVLLLRQVAAAFWFTLLILAALTLPIVSFAEKFPNLTEPMLVIVLGLYSIAGFLFARWLFLRAQDVQWTGGNIGLPEFRRAEKTKTASKVKPVWRPRAALFFKELQLHQSQFVIAGALLLLHLAVIATRRFGDFKDSPTMEFVLNGFWVLWFVMPLIVGCAAVAEERKLGTLEGQLCLPVRRRTQFWIKFITAMLLSLILAIGIPLLLEGSRILPEFHLEFLEALSKYFLMKHKGFPGEAIAYALGFINVSMPILIFLGIGTVISAVSFYVSTLSRNALQSLAPAVLGIMLTFMLLIGASVVEGIFQFSLWRGWLIYLIGVPILTLMLFALMYWNFKRVLVGWAVLQRNILVIALAVSFVIGTTTAIYHRVWELVMWLEPAHGATRLSTVNSVTMQSDSRVVTIGLPDGKFWLCVYEPSPSTFADQLFGSWKLRAKFSGGKFLEGTNWASIVVSHNGTIGVKKDGTLWASEKIRERPETDVSRLLQIGQDDGWKAVAGSFPWGFILKQDGTLWRLNTDTWDRKKPWPGIQAFQLQRLGAEADWSEIFQTEWRTAFRKANGHTWVSGITSVDAPRLELDKKTTLYRAEHLDRLNSSTLTWAGRGSGYVHAGVHEDGKLIISSDFSSRRVRHEEQNIQLGHDSNWVAVAGYKAENLITLKADGTLWKWRFSEDPIARPETASAVRLSKHSDWIAIADLFGNVVSLAADGSLWFWQFDPRYFSPSDETMPPLLAASRKPQKIGNIFDTPLP